MRYLTVEQVLELHRRIIDSSGGAPGIRDIDAIHAALARPQMEFEGRVLYPNVEDKAAALCHSLVVRHSFVDGNKRVAHASMEVFLVLNGYEITASAKEQEKVMLSLAAGQVTQEQLALWLENHITKPDFA